MSNKLPVVKAKRIKKVNVAEAFFEKRLYNDFSTPELLDNFMKKFIEMAGSGKYTYISEIIAELHYEETYFNHLIDRHPEAKAAYDYGKQLLGLAGLKGVRDFKYKESAINPYLHLHLPFVAEAQKVQHEKEKELRQASKQELIKSKMKLIPAKDGSYDVTVEDNIIFEGEKLE